MSWFATSLAALALAAFSQDVRVERYAVTGMVLSVAPESRAFVASIEPIPGYMAAMTMSFRVRDAKELAAVEPGAIIAFTLVVSAASSHAEGIRVRRYEGLEQDPLSARRLSLLKQIASGAASKALPIGAVVPDFRLVDHKGRPFALTQARGKVVAINFMYTTCKLPDFCLRIVNHFGVLQKRFAQELGRDLVLLTITFDPVRDQPEVLDRYAAAWKPKPDAWRFLTGPPADIQRVLEMFGMSAFPNEGLMDHSLRTALVDRAGRLVANIEGNQYTSDQLVDLTRSVLVRSGAPPGGRP